MKIIEVKNLKKHFTLTTPILELEKAQVNYQSIGSL